jgi:hypothetical protein
VRNFNCIICARFFVPDFARFFDPRTLRGFFRPIDFARVKFSESWRLARGHIGCSLRIPTPQKNCGIGPRPEITWAAVQPISVSTKHCSSCHPITSGLNFLKVGERAYWTPTLNLSTMGHRLHERVWAKLYCGLLGAASVFIKLRLHLH